MFNKYDSFASTQIGIMQILTAYSLKELANVADERIINIIVDYVYNNNSFNPLKIPRSIFKDILNACTKEAPFRSPDRVLYPLSCNLIARNTMSRSDDIQMHMCYINAHVLLEPAQPEMCATLDTQHASYYAVLPIICS